MFVYRTILFYVWKDYARKWRFTPIFFPFTSPSHSSHMDLYFSPSLSRPHSFWWMDRSCISNLAVLLMRLGALTSLQAWGGEEGWPSRAGAKENGDQEEDRTPQELEGEKKDLSRERASEGRRNLCLHQTLNERVCLGVCVCVMKPNTHLVLCPLDNLTAVFQMALTTTYKLLQLNAATDSNL